MTATPWSGSAATSRRTSRPCSPRYRRLIPRRNGAASLLATGPRAGPERGLEPPQRRAHVGRLGGIEPALECRSRREGDGLAPAVELLEPLGDVGLLAPDLELGEPRVERDRELERGLA